ncbi:MAG: hypothetical protein ACLT8H_02250 [Streptococcus parasanguinis]
MKIITLFLKKNYNDQEIMGKIKDFFEYEFTLNKVKTLTESDFIKKLETSDRRELVKFLLSASKETLVSSAKASFGEVGRIEKYLWSHRF